MLSAHHEGKVLKRKLFTVWICKLPTNIWEASGFLFCLWDKYSGTLPSSVIIQLLVLLNAIKIVLYQWPHAVRDCSFSFNFFSGEVVVAMVIVINFVIGGFCWVNLIWLTASTVQLQVPDNNQLSDYIVRLQLYRMNSEKKKQKMHQSYLRKLLWFWSLPVQEKMEQVWHVISQAQRPIFLLHISKQSLVP